MATVFDDVMVTTFQPKSEKDAETGEKIDRMVFKGELKVDNSLQIGELFNGKRKELIQISLEPYDDFQGKLSLHDVHLEDFSVKSKMVRIGHGKEAERIPVEMVNFNMSVKMDEAGELLKKMYSVFRKTVKMEIA